MPSQLAKEFDRITSGPEGSTTLIRLEWRAVKVTFYPQEVTPIQEFVDTDIVAP